MSDPLFRLRALTILSASILLSLLATQPAWAADPPPPTVAITAPAANATVKGTVTLSAQATAGSGDTMYTVSFFDGVNSIGSFSCDTAQTSCAATVKWGATGLTGQHTITARATGESGVHADSAGVMVTVLTPPPAITITAPVPGTVKGTVPVTATATTDPALNDYPTSLTFFDGVNSIGSVDCQGQQSCTGTINWKATGLSDVHALTARVRTDEGVTTTSAPVSVTVVTPPPTVQITKPSAGASLHGTVTVSAAAATDPALDDYPTSIELFDGANRIDGFTCQGQQTCAGSIKWNTSGLKGRHTLKAVVHTEQGATGTSRTVTVGQPVQIHAKPRCSLSAHRVKVGGHVRGTCTVPGAKQGTRVALKYRTASGSYATALTVKTGPGGAFHFTLHASKRATYRLVVVVSANGRYLKTTKSIGTLRVT
jgi:hypothetical protein